MMSLQSSGQDLTLEGEKVKREDILQRLFETEKSALSQQVEASSGRRLLDQLGQSTREWTAALTNVHDSVPADCIEQWYARKEIKLFI